MDTQFWVWVLIVVVTLLARVFSKRSKPAQQPGEEEDYGNEPSQPSSKPISFEELLREIQASRQPSRPQPQPVPVKPVPEYVDYDDDIRPEVEDLEEVDYDYRKKDNIYKVYEEAKQQAFIRPSLEEEGSVASPDMKFEHFKIYDLEKKGPGFDFLDELKDPQGFRKAFIMSEILTRKY